MTDNNQNMDDLETQKIETLVVDLIEAGDKTPTQLSGIWGVSEAMISRYKKGHNYPSLKVARKIYTDTGKVIYPYSKQAVEKDD